LKGRVNKYRTNPHCNDIVYTCDQDMATAGSTD